MPTASQQQQKLLLIDISNTFAKIAVATRNHIGRPIKISTAKLSPRLLLKKFPCIAQMQVVICSVVPEATKTLSPALPPTTIHVSARNAGGLRIDYPRPATIGADRIANALACTKKFGAPAIVVDFGTAVTFDVISADAAYIGGVIAPGLNVMAEYLHSRTALLPLIRLERPQRAVGRSTKEAMLSGAVHGYRGLVKEILAQICREQFIGVRPTIVATGGDAKLIGGSVRIFDVIDPLLTLRGLHIIGRQKAES